MPDCKENKQLTQAVVFLRRHFLCGALLCNCSSAEREVYLHKYNGNVQQKPLCAASCFTKDIPSLPGSRLRFFIAGQIQHRTVHRFLYTPAQVDAPTYSSRLYAKNPVFEIVHEESVKVYHLHMYSGGIQQTYLCVESCVTEEFNISPRFSLHLRLPAAVAKLAVFPRL